MTEITIEQRIGNLKIDFTRIIDLKDENLKIFETLDHKVAKLKLFYSEFIKNHKQNLFIFNLDSFHFQGKIIDIEYDDMKRLFYAITNRMYCEYYKLYKFIIIYILENIHDKKLHDLINVNSNFPIYKDLEPFKQYDFDVIQQLHEIIITILISINSFYTNKEYDLKVHQSKNDLGLSIDNFIHTFNYNNIVIRENLTLFISYTEFFHKLHTKYLKRFTTKMQLFISQINHDIKFEDNVKINNTKNKTMIEKFKEEVDTGLLSELKNSINEIQSFSIDTDDMETQNIELQIQEPENLFVEKELKETLAEKELKETQAVMPTFSKPSFSDPIADDDIIL